jgi:hypothetical protein
VVANLVSCLVVLDTLQNSRMPRTLALSRLQADIADAHNEAIPNVQKIGKGDVQGQGFCFLGHVMLCFEDRWEQTPSCSMFSPAQSFLLYVPDEKV